MNGAVLTNFAHVFSFRIAGNKYRGLAFSLGKKTNKHRQSYQRIVSKETTSTRPRLQKVVKFICLTQSYLFNTPILRVYLSVSLSVSLSVGLSVGLSVCRSVGLFVYRSFYLSVYLSVFRLSVCLFACQPVCRFVD